MKPELELVSTGAELLNGRVVNRHAQWLGAKLDLVGWRLLRDTTVPDDITLIREAVFAALQRVDVVIVTGGLGPTTDDVTRDVGAEWMQTRLILHEPSRQAVLKAYRDRNKPLNSTVERHALVVEGADVLANHHGLAPGEHLVRGGKHLFLLPGPPREFQGVANDHVLPWLVEQNAVTRTRLQLFQVAGLGESDIAAKLEQSGFEKLNIEVAYCAEPGRVTIRIREVDGSAGDFTTAISCVREALRDAIYSEADESIEVTISRQLKAMGKTMALAESCTGGLLGQRLTAIPGASGWLRGGVIAYHNDVKAAVLGIDKAEIELHGAVSEPVAHAMAQGVRNLTGADLGVAITGIAGPDGGTPDKPVGLVYLAVADQDGVVTQMLRLGGGRDTIREASATMALNLIRTRLRRD